MINRTLCVVVGVSVQLPLCVLQKLQDLDERRGRKLGQGYSLFSDTEKHVMPIIGKCLEGITKAGTNVNERNVSPQNGFKRSLFFVQVGHPLTAVISHGV